MKTSGVFRIVLIAAVLGGSVSTAQEKKTPDLTTKLAASDPDFKIQGEYEGEVSGKGKYGAQVVAKGNGKFHAYFLPGGLPGAGWDPAKLRVMVDASTKANAVTFATKSWTGTIADGTVSGNTAD